jgi:hypothetical protein
MLREAVIHTVASVFHHTGEASIVNSPAHRTGQMLRESVIHRVASAFHRAGRSDRQLPCPPHRPDASGDCNSYGCLSIPSRGMKKRISLPSRARRFKEREGYCEKLLAAHLAGGAALRLATFRTVLAAVDGTSLQRLRSHFVLSARDRIESAGKG